ncbi:uncharacterized protein V1510DRAFT_178205 [Dipodascopsis tothii]|uniref:uncharacterized protein n=1 Tax=Dipodascopsis tothii TaxID=44089 RepID=UPI0034CDF669
MSVPATILQELVEPITSVVIDSGVAYKLIKHTTDAFPGTVSGFLLGLDQASTLTVSHAVPFPSSSESGSDDSISAKSKGNVKYQADMIEGLKQVNVDANAVGYYVSSYMGNFFNQSLIDHSLGFQLNNPNSIVIVHDVARSTQGSLFLKAYKLSDAFRAAHSASNGKFSTEAVIKAKLSYRNVLQELPVQIKNSHLSVALLQQLDQPTFDKAVDGADVDPTTLNPASAISQNFDSLDLTIDPFLEKSVEYLLESVDEYYTEQGTHSYFQRQMAREQSKVQSWLQKTRAENANRKANNLPLINEDDWQKHYKLPTEPSRLDNLVISAQINQYCSQIEEYSSVVSTKLFATQKGLIN